MYQTVTTLGVRLYWKFFSCSYQVLRDTTFICRSTKLQTLCYSYCAHVSEQPFLLSLSIYIVYHLNFLVIINSPELNLKDQPNWKMKPLSKTKPGTTSKCGRNGKKNSNPKNSNIESQSFVPKIKKCWSNSLASNSSHITAQTCNKTTCILCPNIVVLSDDSNSHNEVVQKTVKNIWKHLKISSMEMPKRFTNIIFPFCLTCKPLVTLLWKQQLKLDAILKSIEETVHSIERVVVDAEILGSRGQQPGTSSMARLEQEKFSMLRQLILAGKYIQCKLNFMQIWKHWNESICYRLQK